MEYEINTKKAISAAGSEEIKIPVKYFRSGAMLIANNATLGPRQIKLLFSIFVQLISPLWFRGEQHMLRLI